MKASHGNRADRRRSAPEQSRSSKRLTKTVAALGAALVIGTGAAAPTLAAELNAGQIAENNYLTTQNIITITDNLGRTQIALLAPLGSVLPEGWVPAVTSKTSSSTEELNILGVISEAAGMLVAVPDTSHVPGIPALAGVGVLPAQLLLGGQLVGRIAGLGLAGAQVGVAAGLLKLVNPATTLANGAATVTQTFGGDKVNRPAGQLTGIPSIDEALSFVGGTKTSTSWNGTFNLPIAGISSQSWITQDRLTVNSMSADQIKQQFSDRLNTPESLEVAKGQTKCVKTGLACLSLANWQWVPTKDSDGNPVYAVTYDPNSLVAEALSTLDNVDVQGFSIIKREVGSAYTLPLAGSAGWLAGMTQVVVPGTNGQPDKVSTVPFVAGGFKSPGDLFTIGGQYTPGIVTNGAQSVKSVLGSRSSSFSIPLANLGIEQTSVLESAYIGPDGFIYDSGWTIAILNIGGTPIPVIYSLGSVNFGPQGIGFTSPSIFGVGLPGFQLGTTPTGAGASNGGLIDAIGGIDLPTSLIVLDPKLVFDALGINDPTGLGLDDPVGMLRKVETALSPLFTKYVTPTASQISQALADVATELVNQASTTVRDTSAAVAEATDQIADSTEEVTNQVTSTTSGKHALDESTYVGRHRVDSTDQSVADNRATDESTTSNDTSADDDGSGQ